MGAGAYICGEETSLLESLEGRRAEVRYRPPLPAIKGLFGQPTVINNVISLASVPIILQRGAAFYRDFGMGRSRGTLPIQLAGNLKRGGLVEKAFGVTLRELLYDFGGGSPRGARSARCRSAVRSAPTCRSRSSTRRSITKRLRRSARWSGTAASSPSTTRSTWRTWRDTRWSSARIESCGKCTPCRIGSTRGVEVIDRIMRGEQRTANLAQLESLCDTMQHGSLCGLGGMTPFPVMSALKHFPGDFARDR